MVSSDLDGDHVLNEEEWEEAFKHVGGEYFNLLCNRSLIVTPTCMVSALMVNPFGIGIFNTSVVRLTNRLCSPPCWFCNAN